jgi:hypothetical protein
MEKRSFAARGRCARLKWISLPRYDARAIAMITRKQARWIVLAGAVWLSDGPPLRAGNWPQWRGPFLNGSTSETHRPARVSRPDHLRWTTPLPGPSGMVHLSNDNIGFRVVLERKEQNP